MRQLRWWTGLVVGAAVVAGAACERGKETGAVRTTTSTGTSTAPASAATEKSDLATVRVVHAIPGAGAVSVYVGDTAEFPRVAYRTVSKWKTINDQLGNFRLIPAGKGAKAEAIATNKENLQGGNYYTVIALPTGSTEGNATNAANKAAAAATGKENVTLRVLDDDFKPVTNGKARVRFVNALASGEEVDLYASGQKDPIFDDVNTTREAGWKEIDPLQGTLTVRVDATGGKPGRVLATVTHANLEAGKSYTYVVTGSGATGDVIKIVDDVKPTATAAETTTAGTDTSHAWSKTESTAHHMRVKADTGMHHMRMKADSATH